MPQLAHCAHLALQHHWAPGPWPRKAKAIFRRAVPPWEIPAPVLSSSTEPASTKQCHTCCILWPISSSEKNVVQDHTLIWTSLTQRYLLYPILLMILFMARRPLYIGKWWNDVVIANSFRFDQPLVEAWVGSLVTLLGYAQLLHYPIFCSWHP